MKNILSLKLFGNQTIYFNQTEIFFSFSKINALLYYILLHGTVSRDEIAGSLWDNKDNQTARKNLRNTIYQANKLLGYEIIVSPNRNVLTFNPDLVVMSDVHRFTEKPEEHLFLYEGEFLQGFYIKDAEIFENWLSKRRAHYEQLYVTACYHRIENKAEERDVEDIEKHLYRLIEIDEFEEKNYYLLMRLYQEHHRTNKVIELYYRLVNLLDKELGVEPNEDIQQVYHEVVAKDRNEKKIKEFLSTDSQFWGRGDEIGQLEEYFERVKREKQVRTLVLVGGVGVGKRRLTRQVLATQNKDFQLVTLECYQEERLISFQPLYSLLEGLGDFIIQHQLMTLVEWENLLQEHFYKFVDDFTLPLKELDISRLSQFIVQILQMVAQRKGLVILIEDCHWMDRESVLVLQTVMNHLTDSTIAVVLTKQLRKTPYLEHFFNRLQLHNRIEFMELRAFSEEESYQFLHYQLKGRVISDKELKQMIKLSQGIPFFLAEYAQALVRGEKLTALPLPIQSKLSLLLDLCSDKEKELIAYLSCCRQAVSISLVANLMSLTFDEMVGMLENLEENQFLMEAYQGDHLVIDFQQPLMKLFCYERLSLSRRRMIHHQLAQALEGNFEHSQHQFYLLDEIAYHYEFAKRPIKSLEYKLKYLEATLPFHHELFPIYSKKIGFIEPTNEESSFLIKKRFEIIEKEIKSLEEEYASQREFQMLSIRFLYLIGRYNIRIGKYVQGIEAIQHVLSCAKEWNQMDIVLEAYRQLIYYCIQTENVSEMRHYTELALEAAVQDNNHEAIGINLRLKGLYHLIQGNEEQAILFIRQSIECFSLMPSLEFKYSIQIGAALDYLAEIEQVRGNLKGAIDYQERAIELTENKTSEPSILVFYIGLGISYYLLNKLDKAESIFMEVREKLRHLSFPWKEVQLEVYLALISYRKGNYQLVRNFLRNKEELVSRYSNPRDKGLMAYLLAFLKYKRIQKEISSAIFDDLLEEDYGAYHDVAIEYLNSYRDRHLLASLSEMKATLSQIKIQ